MKLQIFTLLIGIALGVVVTLPLTVVAGSDAVTRLTGAAAALPVGQQTQEKTPQPGQTHQRMHEMMDSMMGEGSSDRMHQSMPGSEEMMEQCAKHMEGMGGSGMEGMMGMMMNGSMQQGMMQDAPNPEAAGK
jgi:hypothetical protein